MIAVLLALTVSAAPVDVTFVVRERLPATVQAVRMARPLASSAWQLADVRNVEVRSGRFVLSAPAGEESLVMVRAAGRPGYLLHGPLRWPETATAVDMPSGWRRTVRGQHPSGGTLVWVSPSPEPANVVCQWVLPEQWECLGVPPAVGGVVVRPGAAAVLYSIAGEPGPRSEVEDLPTLSAAWGRLLVAENARVAGGPDSTVVLRIRALHLYRVPARPNAARLDVVPDNRIQVRPIGTTAAWVTGQSDAPGSWLEVTFPGVGSARIDVPDVAAGAPDVVFPVTLERPIAVFGRVTGPLAVAAPDAIVSLYRFGEEVRSADGTRTYRERIAAGERSTDADGAFAFPDLVPERYEVLAVHPAYGRAVKLVEPHASGIELALKPPPTLEGRVVRDGVPQPGVPVSFVPDLAAFAAAEDPTELRGSEAETDADGRFRVFAALAGRGELKIGSQAGGMKRVPLPSAEALPATTQLGDIEVDAGATVSIVFEEAGSCEPVLTGPLGRAGLTVVRAVRLGPAMFNATLPEPGRWNIVVLCNRRERGVVPSAVEISAGQHEKTVYLRWP